MRQHDRQAGSWVYTEIRDRIEKLDYKPGEELHLAGLSSGLGVSRSPVRDALLRLERDRLVDIFPQKGTRVSYLDAGTVLQERYLRSTVETRIFEDFLSHDFDEKMWLRIISALHSELLYQETALKTDDLVSFFSHDISFHRVFYECMGLERIYQVVQAHTGNEKRIRLLNMKMRKNMESVLTEHQALVNAIQAKDAGKAKRLLTQHFGKLSEDMEELVRLWPDYFSE